MVKRIASHGAVASLALLVLLLNACAMSQGGPKQGLKGSFTTYGPPKILRDCKPMVTQAEMDDCRHENERVIEEPLVGAITVRNIGTQASQNVPLDAAGAYSVNLAPGQYEVCLAEECSDPLDVRLGKFLPYGQRIPRATDTTMVTSPLPSGKYSPAGGRP